MLMWMWLELNKKLNGNVDGDVIRDLDGNVDRSERKDGWNMDRDVIEQRIQMEMEMELWMWLVSNEKVNGNVCVFKI